MKLVLYKGTLKRVTKIAPLGIYQGCTALCPSSFDSETIRRDVYVSKVASGCYYEALTKTYYMGNRSCRYVGDVYISFTKEKILEKKVKR